MLHQDWESSPHKVKVADPTRNLAVDPKQAQIANLPPANQKSTVYLGGGMRVDPRGGNIGGLMGTIGIIGRMPLQQA